MAVYTSRNILICAIPAVVAIMTIIWYRRRRKRDTEIMHNQKMLACNAIESNSSMKTLKGSCNESNAKLSTCDPSGADAAEPTILLETPVGAFSRPSKNDINIFEVQLHKKSIFEVQESSESKCSITTVPVSIDAMVETNKLSNQLQPNVSETDNTSQDTNESNVIKLPEAICDESSIIKSVVSDASSCRTNSEGVVSINNKDSVASTINELNIGESDGSCNCESNLSEEITKEEILKIEEILKYTSDDMKSGDTCSDNILIKSEANSEDGKEEIIDNSSKCIEKTNAETNLTLDSDITKNENTTITENLDSKNIENGDKEDKLSQSHNSMQKAVMDDTGNNSSQGHYSDIHSEGSSDSGKGGSDIQLSTEYTHFPMSEDGLTVYEFELPQDLCGRLIGRQGKSVNYIKNHSNANVFIKKHPVNPRMKLCTIEGNGLEIGAALELIRRRFPPSHFPNVTLAQFNTNGNARGVPIPETLQLHLPEAVSCDVIMSSMVTAGHFFLQQPTHPTYTNLNRLDTCMAACYTQMETPQLPRPVEAGVICAAPVMSGWYRAQVVYVCESMEECDVKFVDYGGYSRVPISSLRQIRSDFMTLPFQASECYLANVQSLDEDGSWPVEACATFEELAQGQILQAQIVGYADDSIPFVHLYKLQGISTLFINRELVNRGVAQWIEHQ